MSFLASPAPDRLPSGTWDGQNTGENSSRRSINPFPKHGGEFSFTLLPLPGEEVAALFRRMTEALRGATILHLLAFGPVGSRPAAMETLRRRFDDVDWPVTWVEGGPCDSGGMAGLQVWAFAGSPVQRLRFDNRVVGSVFQDGAARHCLLGGLGPAANTGTRADQTEQALKYLKTALGLAGFTLGDTVRTWFFLEDILSWYDEFNRVRTQFYSGHRFRTGSLPASTGVGARNPAGAALALAARAMQPLNASARAGEVASPLQCPAPAYGSSFSRAMEISSAGSRQLLISGTASIAPAGETLWRGDVRQQVALTMQVVEAILRARGCSPADLTRAVAYFKHRADAPALAEWCAANGWPALPAVTTQCDICRDDLLFELEADAITRAPQ